MDGWPSKLSIARSGELPVYRTDLACNHCGRLSLVPFPDDLVLHARSSLPLHEIRS
jgi:hypothetical protein